MAYEDFVTALKTDLTWEKEEQKKTDLLILVYLAVCKNSRTLQCNPSVPTISESIYLGSSAIERALKRMKERGILTVINPENDGNWYYFYWDGIHSEDDIEEAVKRAQEVSQRDHKGITMRPSGYHSDTLVWAPEVRQPL